MFAVIAARAGAMRIEFCERLERSCERSGARRAARAVLCVWFSGACACPASPRSHAALICKKKQGSHGSVAKLVTFAVEPRICEENRAREAPMPSLDTADSDADTRRGGIESRVLLPCQAGVRKDITRTSQLYLDPLI